MVVIDASAAVQLALGGAAAERVTALVEGQTLRAPVTFDVEACATLRRFVRSGRLAPTDGWLRLAAISRMAVERVAILPLLATAFALRDRFGGADVFYAIVARESGAPLITTDLRLARACDGYVEAIVP